MMDHIQSKYSLFNYLRAHIALASGLAVLLCASLVMIPAEQVSATRYGMLPVSLSTATDNQPIPSALAAAASVSTNKKAWAPTWKTISVRSGDNPSTMFNRMGVSNEDMHAIIDSPEAASLKKLFPGEVFTYLLNAQGKLQQLKYQASVYESTTVQREGDIFAINHVVRTPEIKTATASAVINNSLFVDGQTAGLSTPTVLELTKIFGWDIDLFEIQDGDSFSVVYEQKFLDNKKVEDGEVLAASFTNNGKTFSAVRYTNKSGDTDYYTPQGYTMHKEFLRTPVDFARISSYFSTARKHPILNTIRAHKGVDYAAPQGTPIRAAGKGKIVFAAKKSGYGNVIEIKHNGAYSTLYAHMKGFASGIKNGANVKQGQVIGYVGMTGLATGPHLHYEFHVNGQYVNPLSAKLPMADPIAANEKQRFASATQPLVALLKTGSTTVQKSPSVKAAKKS